MRKGLVITLVATLFTAGCAHYINDGTYSEFKYPLPAGIEYCLGDSTLSPETGKTLSDFELYNCAEALYKWAETDCSQGNYFAAETLCDDALENLGVLSDERKQTQEYKVLKEDIDNLKIGIQQRSHCRE